MSNKCKNCCEPFGQDIFDHGVVDL